MPILLLSLDQRNINMPRFHQRPNAYFPMKCPMMASPKAASKVAHQKYGTRFPYLDIRALTHQPEKAPAPEHKTTVTITAGQCKSSRPSSQRLTMRNDVTASAGNDAAAVMTHGLGSINASKRHAANNTARGKIQASYTDGEALAKAASNIHKKISAPAANAAMNTTTVRVI